MIVKKITVVCALFLATFSIKAQDYNTAVERTQSALCNCLQEPVSKVDLDGLTYFYNFIKQDNKDGKGKDYLMTLSKEELNKMTVFTPKFKELKRGMKSCMEANTKPSFLAEVKEIAIQKHGKEDTKKAQLLFFTDVVNAMKKEEACSNASMVVELLTVEKMKKRK